MAYHIKGKDGTIPIRKLIALSQLSIAERRSGHSASVLAMGILYQERTVQEVPLQSIQSH